MSHRAVPKPVAYVDGVTTSPNAQLPTGGGLTIRPKGFLFPYFLLIFKPMLSVDGGDPQALKWQANFIALPPGRHTVRCYLPYLFWRHFGDSTVEVDLSAEVSTTVEWRTPWRVSREGKWRFVSPS
jgi:hypothetical protein